MLKKSRLVKPLHIEAQYAKARRLKKRIAKMKATVAAKKVNEFIPKVILRKATDIT